jgi:hypothetical protein
MKYKAKKYDKQLNSWGDFSPVEDCQTFNSLAEAKKWIGRYCDGIVKKGEKTVWSRFK